jgi:hypothetical protein
VPVLNVGLHLIAQARFLDYSHPMINKKLFLKTDNVGFVLGAVLLAALTQSTGYAGGLHIGIDVAPVVVVAPAVVVEDDYVYYPSYGLYYNSSRHQYAHLEGDTWVWAPAPSGVSVDVLLASPSVNMDFHDSLANHHKEILQRYPKNWKPSDEHQDRKEDKKDDRKGPPDAAN